VRGPGDSGRAAFRRGFAIVRCLGVSLASRVPHTMKIRSLFLCTCMTVVPLTALVSHRLPGGIVQAAGGLFTAVRGGGESPGESQVDAMPEPVAEVPPEPLAAVHATAEPATTEPATNGSANSSPAMTSPARIPDEGDLADIQRRFVAAGATAVECRPLPGHGGGFTATCRVGVDAESSLFRMFQASGSDPSSASRALLEAVELWRERATPRTARRPVDVQVGR
jgi:hypothetical protein